MGILNEGVTARRRQGQGIVTEKGENEVFWFSRKPYGEYTLCFVAWGSLVFFHFCASIWKLFPYAKQKQRHCRVLVVKVLYVMILLSLEARLVRAEEAPTDANIQPIVLHTSNQQKGCRFLTANSLSELSELNDLGEVQTRRKYEIENSNYILLVEGCAGPKANYGNLELDLPKHALERSKAQSAFNPSSVNDFSIMGLDGRLVLFSSFE